MRFSLMMTVLVCERVRPSATAVRRIQFVLHLGRAEIWGVEFNNLSRLNGQQYVKIK